MTKAKGKGKVKKTPHGTGSPDCMEVPVDSTSRIVYCTWGAPNSSKHSRKTPKLATGHASVKVPEWHALALCQRRH